MLDGGYLYERDDAGGEDGMLCQEQLPSRPSNIPGLGVQIPPGPGFNSNVHFVDLNNQHYFEIIL